MIPANYVSLVPGKLVETPTRTAAQKMKTPSWRNRNRFTSIVRVVSAGTLISAAAAMAFIAGSDRLITLGRPSSQLSQDREAKGKLAGDPDAVLRSARTIPSEGPTGGYEAYKSAARTYPANVIPPSFVRNAKDTFSRIAAHGDAGNNKKDRSKHGTQFHEA